MIWETWSDFFAMGGYAIYVWGSFSVVAICVALEVITLRARQRIAEKQFPHAGFGTQSDSGIEQ